jgi:hypothetical protein
MNALLARNEGEGSPAARLAWLRAALAWLAFEPPEALPAAAVEAILGEAEVAPGRIETLVGEALCEALGGASGGGTARPSPREATMEVRSARAALAIPERLIGGAGAAVLWSGDMGKGYLAYPLRDRLIAIVMAALREIAPGIALVEGGAILVDLNSGLDIPRTRAEALSAALRAGVGKAVFGEETILLDAPNRPRLAAELKVTLSPLVATIEGPDQAMTVRFRGRLPEAAVTGLDAELLAPVRERGKIPLGTVAVLCGKPLVETERLLRDLEARRIVRLEFEDRADGGGKAPAEDGQSLSAPK